MEVASGAFRSLTDRFDKRASRSCANAGSVLASACHAQCALKGLLAYFLTSLCKTTGIARETIHETGCAKIGAMRI